MSWVRARKPEHKEQRRRAILEAAAELFREQGLDATSLNAIAARAGISKANVYRYFESREEIFLHLLLGDYEEWVSALEETLAPLAGSGAPEAVARALTESYLARPRLPSLVAALSSVLERNVTLEVVVAFKTRFMALAVRLTNALHAALPSLDMDRTRRFLMYSHFIVAGMWPSAHPPEAVRQALERPELQALRVEIERDLRGAIETLLRGLLPA